MSRSLRFGTIFMVLATGALLARCGSSASSPTTPTTPAPGGGGGTGSADVVITISGIAGNMSFSPTPGAVKVGQTVAWHNNDSIAHHPAQDAGAWDAGTVNPGSTSAPIKMTTAGTSSYHCTFHPSMVSSLTIQ
jgi:plastocyanin